MNIYGLSIHRRIAWHKIWKVTEEKEIFLKRYMYLFERETDWRSVGEGAEERESEVEPDAGIDLTT